MTTPQPTATEQAPEPARVKARRQKGFGTRELVLCWCLWLIGTWLVLASTLGWARLTGGLGWSPSYRWMVFSAMIGLMCLWPAVRLSQGLADVAGNDAKATRDFPALGPVWRDWLALNAVFHAVLWPMKVLSQWSVEQTLWIAVAMLAWSLLAGLIIAWGRCGQSGSMRTLAMLGCVGIVVAEPALMALTTTLRGDGFVAGPMRLSPVETLWQLSVRPAIYMPDPWAYHALAVALAALLGWAVLAILRPLRR